MSHRLISPANATHRPNLQLNQYKKASGETFLYWLGERSIFQTFEDLDTIVDKETELKEIRQLLDDNTSQDEDV